MAEEKSLLEQVGDGIANAFGVSTEQVPTIKQGKGVLVPKLTPVPTVKRGINPNVYASQLEAKEAKKQAVVNKLISKSNSNAQTIKKLQAQTRLAQKQAAQASSIARKQDAHFKKLMRDWEKRNAAQLNKVSDAQRQQLRNDYAVYAKKLSTNVVKAQAARPKTQQPKTGRNMAVKHSSQKRIARGGAQRTAAKKHHRPQRQRRVISSPGNKSSMAAQKQLNTLTQNLRAQSKQTTKRATFRSNLKKRPVRTLARTAIKMSPTAVTARAGKAIAKKILKPSRLKSIAQKRTTFTNNFKKKPVKTLARTAIRMSPTAVTARVGKKLVKKVFRRKRR